MAAAAATAGRGQVADYIPALASVDPDAFGMAMATFDGEIYGVGQVERPFSVQSVSKLFSLALLLAEIGDRVWQGVGRITFYHITICTPIHQIINPFRSQILYVCIKKEYNVCFTLNRFSKPCFHSDSFCRKHFSVLLNYYTTCLTS